MPKQKQKTKPCRRCGDILPVDNLSRSGLCRQCGNIIMTTAADLMRSLRRNLNA